MDQNPSFNSMRTVILWVFIASMLFVPLSAVRVLAAVFLMTFFPGFLIWSLVYPQDKNPLLFLVCGTALLTVLNYYSAWTVWFPIPVVISFVCAVVLEKKKIPLPVVTRKTVYLAGCILFIAISSYPWSSYTAFYPPGDEMKLHLLHTNTILQEKALPSSYAPLYPEITTITQPLGFHGVTAVVADLARTSPISVSIIVGVFVSSLGCVSIYFLGKTLFSEEKGLAAAFSFAFLSFVSHQLGVSGSYITLAGITLQICAVGLTVRAHQHKTRNAYILAGFFYAACFSTDLNAFLPLIFFFICFLIMNRFFVYILASFFIFSLPQLARFSLPMPTSLEQMFISEWAQQALVNLKDIHIFLFSLGPLLVIFALLQLFSHDLKRSFSNAVVGVYTICLCIPLLLSFVLPLWYFFDPVLILRMVFIPLSILSGVFLVRLRTLAQVKWFLPGLLIIAAAIQIADPFTILPVSRPTADSDSLSAYQWISENTTTEDSFWNFASHGDSSAWIPVSAERRVHLPFHLYYKGDNAMSRLHLPLRFTDSLIFKTMPDSDFARNILETHKISHIYIDEKSSIDVEIFLESPLYCLEFHQGDVYIFSVTEYEPPPCDVVTYQPGGRLREGSEWLCTFSNLKEGSIIGIHYTDSGSGNVDIEINGEYVGTIFRFDTKDHFVALFLLPPSEEIVVSFLPYEDVFYVDYLFIYQCAE
jgi:hypothetical protein